MQKDDKGKYTCLIATILTAISAMGLGANITFFIGISEGYIKNPQQPLSVYMFLSLLMLGGTLAGIARSIDFRQIKKENKDDDSE